MSLDYQTRAQDFAERRLSGSKLELTFSDRLSLTSLLVENGFQLAKREIPSFSSEDIDLIQEEDVSPIMLYLQKGFSENREYIRFRKEGDRVIGFDRLAPLDLFVDPQHPSYEKKQKEMAYTLLSGEGDDAYSLYQKRVSNLEESLHHLRRAQKEYDNNVLRPAWVDVLRGAAWGLGFGGLVLPGGALLYGMGHPEAAAWLSDGWVTAPGGFLGMNILYHGVDRLIDRPITRSNRRKAERDIKTYQTQFDFQWENYKQNYLRTAEFDQIALKKALGV